MAKNDRDTYLKNMHDAMQKRVKGNITFKYDSNYDILSIEVIMYATKWHCDVCFFSKKIVDGVTAKDLAIKLVGCYTADYYNLVFITDAPSTGDSTITSCIKVIGVDISKEAADDDN